MRHESRVPPFAVIAFKIGESDGRAAGRNLREHIEESLPSISPLLAGGPRLRLRSHLIWDARRGHRLNNFLGKIETRRVPQVPVFGTWVLGSALPPLRTSFESSAS